MSRRKQNLLIITAIFVISIPTWFIFVWHRTMYAPMLLREPPVAIKIFPGNTIKDLAKTLYCHRLISHPHVFIFAARISGHSERLRFGEYQVLPGMSASNLLSNVVVGRGQLKHQITLIEGWTFRDVMNALEQNDNLFHRLKGKTDSQIMSALGHPDQHPEGLFLPETYTFIWGNTDIEILEHAYRRMQNYLQHQWQQRQLDVPYKSAYNALIVASLVEKETSVDDERPIVASVILRRLKKRMRLQVDPTVLYGLNKPYGTRITRLDLQSKTPYNTYVHYGLPPTPIDLPGKASIYAALHPADTPYLYYVATGQGGHAFSKTYQQHLKAVKRYREKLKQQMEEE